jgi:hypothetical protein
VQRPDDFPRALAHLPILILLLVIVGHFFSLSTIGGLSSCLLVIVRLNERASIGVLFHIRRQGVQPVGRNAELRLERVADLVDERKVAVEASAEGFGFLAEAAENVQGALQVVVGVNLLPVAERVGTCRCTEGCSKGYS